MVHVFLLPYEARGRASLSGSAVNAGGGTVSSWHVICRRDLVAGRAGCVAVFIKGSFLVADSVDEALSAYTARLPLVDSPECAMRSFRVHEPLEQWDAEYVRLAHGGAGPRPYDRPRSR